MLFSHHSSLDMTLLNNPIWSAVSHKGRMINGNMLRRETIENAPPLYGPCWQHHCSDLLKGIGVTYLEVPKDGGGEVGVRTYITGLHTPY